MERDRKNNILTEALAKRIPIQSDEIYSITPENLPELMCPFVEHIYQTKPDYILVCDRGARFIGLGVHMLYQRLYGALPTHDRSIHFKKISRTVPPEKIKKSLQGDVTKLLEINNSPHVFVLDDVVNKGITKNIVTNILSELSENRIKITFGAIQGKNIDIVGSHDKAVFLEWTDRQNIIGIDYGYESTIPSAMRTQESYEYRKQISQSMDRFAQSVLTST